jgi:hypothetical protein
MRITDALRGEHAAMRPLLRQLREKTAPGEKMPPPVVKTNADALWTIIRAHTTVEEPLLELLANSDRRGVAEPAQHALDEHEEIQVLLKLSIQGGDQRVLNRAVRLLLGHFFEEERDVFPVAEKVLKPAKQASLGLDWLRARGLTK